MPCRGQSIALGMYLRWSQFEAVAGLAAGNGSNVDVTAAEGLDHTLFTLRTVAAVRAGALIDAALALRTVATVRAGPLIHTALACGCAHVGWCITGAGSGHVDAALALQRL